MSMNSSHLLQIKTELECLVKLLDGKISKEEEVAMEELHQYLIEDDGSWALGDNFLVFVQRVLRDVQSFSPDTRIHMLRTLAYAALKDDVIIILHQDRRDHTLMNFAQDIDKHTPEEQQAWAMFVSLSTPILKYMKVIVTISSLGRLAIFSRMLVPPNGCCTFRSGNTMARAYQIYVSPPRWPCTAYSPTVRS